MIFTTTAKRIFIFFLKESFHFLGPQQSTVYCGIFFLIDIFKAAFLD